MTALAALSPYFGSATSYCRTGVYASPFEVRDPIISRFNLHTPSVAVAADGAMRGEEAGERLLFLNIPYKRQPEAPHL